MSLAELLPSLQTLSRDEKVRLVQILNSELSVDEGGPRIESWSAQAIWSPIGEFEAAAVLLCELDRTATP